MATYILQLNSQLVLEAWDATGSTGGTGGTGGGGTTPSNKWFILFRGDSNTNGGEGTASAPYFTSPDASFVSLVSKALGCTRDPTDQAKWVGTNFATYNAGVGGYTNANLAPGLADLVTQQWDKTKYPNCLVCYMAGTNDENNGITVDQAQGYVNTLKPQLAGIGAKFIISTAIEPSAHQGRPHGTWFTAFNTWLEANALGSVGAAGFVDFYVNNKINRLNYNGADGNPINTDYWSLQQYGGVGGTGNYGVPFDAFHWGDLGHAEYTNQHLLAVIQQVTGQGTGTGNVTPAAPSVNASDAADTLAFAHSLGTSELVVSVNGAAFVAYAGPYQIGDVDLPANYYRCKVKAATGRNESPLASSPAFSKSAKNYTEVSYTDARITNNSQYGGAYSEATSADGRRFATVGRDPLLWYRFTSTKGGRLRWPVSTAPSTEAHSLFGTGNPSAMMVSVDGVLQSQPYPVVNGQIVFDFPFSDGQSHIIQWYPVDSGQNNLYVFEAYN